MNFFQHHLSGFQFLIVRRNKRDGLKLCLPSVSATAMNTDSSFLLAAKSIDKVNYCTYLAIEDIVSK
jgi:hypothetical protein